VKVDVDQSDFALLTPLPELGKDPFHKIVPLCMHLIKRAAHKDADGLPGVGYCMKDTGINIAIYQSKNDRKKNRLIDN
jgi:hypothetical protein